jgi:hypothetical protein
LSISTAFRRLIMRARRQMQLIAGEKTALGAHDELFHHAMAFFSQPDASTFNQSYFGFIATSGPPF